MSEHKIRHHCSHIFGAILSCKRRPLSDPSHARCGSCQTAVPLSLCYRFARAVMSAMVGCQRCLVVPSCGKSPESSGATNAKRHERKPQEQREQEYKHITNTQSKLWSQVVFIRGFWGLMAFLGGVGRASSRAVPGLHCLIRGIVFLSLLTVMRMHWPFIPWLECVVDFDRCYYKWHFVLGRLVRSSLYRYFMYAHARYCFCAKLFSAVCVTSWGVEYAEAGPMPFGGDKAGNQSRPSGFSRVVGPLATPWAMLRRMPLLASPCRSTSWSLASMVWPWKSLGAPAGVGR